LRDLCLHIEEGQFAVIVGASGSGKTTALRMINKLLIPTEGRVLVRGEDLRGVDAIGLRRSIGYVIQGVGLISHMTVSQNIGLVPRLLGWGPERISRTVREKIQTVQLDPDEFLGRYPANLSGGQRQRVGVARALAADPDLVLMDEPFGALDNVLREEIQDEFREIFRGAHKTTVMVTHDMLEAVHLGDRIIVMNEGRIVQDGTPEDVVLRPADPFVEKLLGRRRRSLEAYLKEGAG